MKMMSTNVTNVVPHVKVVKTLQTNAQYVQIQELKLLIVPAQMVIMMMTLFVLVVTTNV